jgi:hypothetical protein
MYFLEGSIIVVLFYIVTQLFIPAIFPNIFEYNWIFKSDKGKAKVDKLSDKKEVLSNEIDKTILELHPDVLTSQCGICKGDFQTEAEKEENMAKKELAENQLVTSLCADDHEANIFEVGYILGIRKGDSLSRKQVIEEIEKYILAGYESRDVLSVGETSILEYLQTLKK